MPEISLSPPPLRVYSPVQDGANFVADVTRSAEAYQRSKIFKGGAEQGSFMLFGPLAYLVDLFYNWLGYHFREGPDNAPSWEGLVYELTLTQSYQDMGYLNTPGGLVHRRSLDKLANAVRSNYTAAAGDGVTDFVTNDASIRRFGRKEEWLGLDNYELVDAQAECDRVLRDYAWAKSIPVEASADEISSLQVGLVGYMFTGNYKYTTTADDTDDTATGWIQDIAAADFELLVAGSIGTNAMAVKRTLDSPSRAWDQVMAIAGRGERQLDGTIRPWRAFVGPGRRFNLEFVDPTPRYYLRGGQFYTSAGGAAAVNPWQVEPGVVRNMDYIRRGAEYSSYLQDASDFILDKVTVGVGSGLSWSTEEFEESDLAAKQLEYEYWLKGDDAPAGGASGGGGHGSLNWKRQAGYKPGTPEWNAAVKGGWKARQEWRERRKARRRRRG